MRARCQEILTATLKDIESREEDQLQIQQLVKAAETSEQRKKAVENSGNKPITIALDGVTPDSNATQIEELLRSLNKDLRSSSILVALLSGVTPSKAMVIGLLPESKNS